MFCRTKAETSRQWSKTWCCFSTVFKLALHCVHFNSSLVLLSKNGCSSRLLIEAKLNVASGLLEQRMKGCFWFTLTTSLVLFQITRASIDALKNWFRDEMQKSDWQLIMELKKTFEIIWGTWTTKTHSRSSSIRRRDSGGDQRREKENKLKRKKKSR